MPETPGPRRAKFRFVPPKISRITEPHERDSLLLLEDEDFRSHMVEALGELDRNEAIRRDFVRDPIGATVRTFLPEHLQQVADTELSDANKLVMSTLANDDFRRWMDDYQRRLLAEHDGDDDPLRSIVEDKNRLLNDLAQALIEHGDATLLKNLIEAASGSGRITADAARRRSRSGVEPIPLPDVDPDIPEPGPRPDPMPQPEVGVVKVAVVVVIAVAVAIAVVVVAADSDQHVVDVDFRNISGPQFRSLADQLVAHAGRLREAGLLEDIEARIQ